MVKNDQKSTQNLIRNRNFHRLPSGFCPADVLDGRMVLDELRALNLAWVKAFARHDGPPVSALIAALNPAEQSAIADSPFALFRLSDPVADSVSDALPTPTSEAGPGRGLQGDELALTVSLFAFGWCLTRIDARAARLLLGLGAGMSQRLLVTPLAQLQASIGSLHRIPDANLESHRVYWQELIAAIRSGSHTRQRTFQLRGVQLLAASALRR